MGDVFDRFVIWIKKPYDPENMDAFGWFAITGLVLLSIWVWAIIIRKIAD